MPKDDKNIVIKDNYLIVNDEQYEALGKLKYCVKILREEERYKVRLFYLFKYYDYIYHNVNFISNLVKNMPLSSLKQYLLDNDIECFNDFNNKNDE